MSHRLSAPIPVTLLTGFLGSGKTTILNTLLGHPDFSRTAVIVNEFGEIGLDHELVVSTTETMVLLQSGCMCCTLRGDLLDTLTELAASRGAGEIACDRVVIETTGLADPAPVLHTLLTSADLSGRFFMDGVPVDHDLVHEGKEQPMVTTTGCICCTAGSDLRSSLDGLLVERRDGSLSPFSRVIVETTGLADPAPIINSLIPGGMSALSLRDHAVARAFRLSGVITVVDIEGIGAVLDDHPESLRQIAFADHVVLTRTDVARVEDWPDRLCATDPALRIHDAADAGFDPTVLLSPGSYSAPGKGEGVEDWLAAETHQHGVNFRDLNRHGTVVAIPLTRDDPVDETALRQFLVRLTSTPGNGMLRIKGLVALRDDPSAPAFVHAVQHRLYPIRRLDS